MAPPSSKDVLQASDTDLCEKMRREDAEQFLTLVRMHLSFVLDISAEESEAGSEKSKFRALKWPTFYSKNRKAMSKGVMEGAPLTQEGICQVYQLIEFLSRESNIRQEGVFRRTGKLTRQQELKTLLNSGVELCLDDGKFSVHDCASVLKNFLAELPEPLLTEAHYQAHCQIAEMCAEDNAQTNTEEPSRLLRALQLLLLLLPAENRKLLADVLELLHLAASHEEANKMSADNLATLFTPHLLCPRKLPPEELHVNSQVMSKVVSFMIKQGSKLFDIPPKLATDIRVHYAEQRQVSTTVASATTESGAANTVFSFVDRQLTAEANSSNPTEAALAGLYAHIQSLPESAHKRRLVKQFNKENGHGTPRHIKKQQQLLSVGSRSFGDSIKKHIFSKGLKRHKHQNSSTDEISKSPSSPLATPVVQEVASTPSIPAAERRVAVTITAPSPTQPKRRVSLDEPDSKLRVSACPSTPSRVSPVAEEGEGGAEVATPTPWSSLQLATSTPAVLVQQQMMLQPPSPVPRTPMMRKSMSPITRSTHRMTKAMQETMMTPRSRKPVLVLSSSNLAQFGSSWDSQSPQQTAPTTLEVDNVAETSLTSDFRDYLRSRSVLTASPVSLSQQPSPDKLSSSLLYCLDGNEPSCSASTSSLMLSDSSSGGSRKRSADSLFADQSISLSSDSAKKSTLESSYSSAMGSSCVRETSL